MYSDKEYYEQKIVLILLNDLNYSLINLLYDACNVLLVDKKSKQYAIQNYTMITIRNIKFVLFLEHCLGAQLFT